MSGRAFSGPALLLMQISTASRTFCQWSCGCRPYSRLQSPRACTHQERKRAHQACARRETLCLKQRKRHACATPACCTPGTRRRRGASFVSGKEFLVERMLDVRVSLLDVCRREMTVAGDKVGIRTTFSKMLCWPCLSALGARQDQRKLSPTSHFSI